MNKFKTYAFWIALSGAVIIFIQSVGDLFGFTIDGGLIENVIMSICGIMVVLGIVSKPTLEQKTDRVEEKNDNGNIKIIEESKDQIEVKLNAHVLDNIQENEIMEEVKTNLQNCVVDDGLYDTEIEYLENVSFQSQDLDEHKEILKTNELILDKSEDNSLIEDNLNIIEDDYQDNTQLLSDRELLIKLKQQDKLETDSNL